MPFIRIEHDFWHGNIVGVLFTKDFNPHAQTHLAHINRRAYVYKLPTISPYVKYG